MPHYRKAQVEWHALVYIDDAYFRTDFIQRDFIPFTPSADSTVGGTVLYFAAAVIYNRSMHPIHI